MRSPKLNLDQPSEAIDAAEARMRLALGLDTRPGSNGHSKSGASHVAPPQPASHDSARPRRRFAQDGDVPVVMLSRGRDGEGGGEGRFATLTAELRDEKAARSRAERALDEANLTIQSLKTKLAHLEIACEERLRDERAASAQIEAQRATERDARARAETRQAEAALALSIAERRIAELEAAARTAATARPAADLFGEPAAPTPAAPKPRRAARRASAQAPLPAEAEEAAAAEGAAEAEEDQPVEWWLPSFRAQRNATTTRKRSKTR